jgi:NTP pyrophosphatase (non-canonical NTP hydrolase)
MPKGTLTQAEADPDKPPLTVVLCGSFRRAPDMLRADYDALLGEGCRVLSPLDIDWTVEEAGFVYSAEEVGDDPQEIEERHLRAMQAAHFVWLHLPDGYVGRSAAMELGYAHACGLRVFARQLPTDITLAPLVTTAGSPAAAAAAVYEEGAQAPSRGLLSLQHYYRRASEARGWTNEDAEQCLTLLSAELEELKSAVSLSGASSTAASAEMADVQLYLVHLANIAGIDLGTAVAEKERINSLRFGPVRPAAAA